MAGLIPTEQRLGSREPEIARQILSCLQESTDEPDGLTLADFGKDDATGESFASVGVQQTTRRAADAGDIAPRQVGHEFIAGGEPDAMLCEHISRRAAHTQVLECSAIAEQPIGIELDSGSNGADRRSELASGDGKECDGEPCAVAA
jgi:hypothetical protein